jgi:hypothetical protein
MPRDPLYLLAYLVAFIVVIWALVQIVEKL